MATELIPDLSAASVFGPGYVEIPGPPGPPGEPGPPNVLTIGTVTTGVTPGATITGTSPAQELNLRLPQGPAGIPGPPGGTANISIGTVTTLPAGSTATATITGTAPNLNLNLGLPQGAAGTPGTQGDPGPAGTNGAPGVQGPPGVVQNIQGSNTVTVNNTNPAAPILQALSIGLGGQTIKNMLSSRAMGTVYTNNTTLPIWVSIGASVSVTAGSLTITVQNPVGSTDTGVIRTLIPVNLGTGGSANVIVPPGGRYECTLTGGTPTIVRWDELRA